MAKYNGVRYRKSKGKYWELWWWNDATGKKQYETVGKIEDYSERQVREIARKKQDGMAVTPGLRCATKAPTIQEWEESWMRLKGTLKPRSLYLHVRAFVYLKEFMGPDTRLDKIQPVHAEEFKAWLLKQPNPRNWGQRKTLSLTYACGVVKRLSQSLHKASRLNLIPFNPFEEVIKTPPKPNHKHHVVTMEELDAIQRECPNLSWRVYICLQRLQGLRVNEAWGLRPEGVDLKARTLTVFNYEGFESTKKATRVMPIFPPMRKMLEKALDQMPQDADRICWQVPEFSQRPVFLRILKRAKIEPWHDLFKTMRANRVSELKCGPDRYAANVVNAWMGHSEDVSRYHYVEVPEETFNRAIGLE